MGHDNLKVPKHHETPQKSPLSSIKNPKPRGTFWSYIAFIFPVKIKNSNGGPFGCTLGFGEKSVKSGP